MFLNKFNMENMSVYLPTFDFSAGHFSSTFKNLWYCIDIIWCSFLGVTCNVLTFTYISVLNNQKNNIFFSSYSDDYTHVS